MSKHHQLREGKRRDGQVDTAVALILDVLKREKKGKEGRNNGQGDIVVLKSPNARRRMRFPVPSSLMREEKRRREKVIMPLLPGQARGGSQSGGHRLRRSEKRGRGGKRQ